MKHVLSISLGSSSRDSSKEVELLGESFLLERRGTDGSLQRFAELMSANDGVVDCLTVGGTNLGLTCGGRFYPFREIAAATRGVTRTPLVDGSGLKNTLERRTVYWLAERGLVDYGRDKVLLTCGIDRFGLAETLDEVGAQVVYGDLMFNIGLPIALHSLRGLQRVGRTLLPLVVRLPFKWLYPTGAKEDVIIPKYERWYRWADVIAGDFMFIRRHMPPDLAGRLIVTNTTTESDVSELQKRGVRALVTTTPVFGGRSFGTNVLEGVFVCLIGKRPEAITPEEYLQVADALGWEPTVRELTPASEEQTT